MEALIGGAPDPVADRWSLVEMRAATSPAVHRLVEDLFLRPEWCSARVGALLPGLALLELPRLRDLLGVRAGNALGRVEIFSWRDLAAYSPVSLAALPEMGLVTRAEILTVAAHAWASAYLGGGDGDPGSTGSPGCGSRSELAVTGPTDQSRGLARAFEDLEGSPGFDVLRRRRLEDSGDRPSQARLAAELGVATQRISQKQMAVERSLARQMREADWPIRVAAEWLRSRLGAVARPEELEGAFVAVDPDGRALPSSLPHRRALLLQLAAYRTTEDWVLGPDIESLTRVVLIASTESDPAGLDAVGRHLHRLGVREEMQLPWILGQWGFRLVDGKVVRSGEPGSGVP